VLLRYSEPDLVQAIERLSNAARAAFAAACAQRLFPAYVKYATKTGKGDPKAMGEVLSRLWRDLTEMSMLDAEVDRDIARCMELIPKEDDRPWVPEQAMAEDAASAVAYALRCRRNRQAKEAGWSARVGYEALDNYVISLEKIDTNVPGAEARVLSHPLIQAELGRQKRDLDDLLAGTVAINQLRDRAIKESSALLP
jgi:uncharacterized protein YjaG (DUF416 family)